MKIALVQLLLLINCFAFAAEPTGSKKKMKNRLIGAWELTYVEYSDAQVFRTQPGQLKLFESNGSYRFLVVSNTGTFVAQQGSFKVLSDSVYTEDIEFSTNPNLRKVSSKVSYAFINEDTLFVSGSVNGVPFREKWVRLKVPSV